VRNPQHTYSKPGRYTVSLTVSGPGDTNPVTKSDYITITTNAAGLVAAYSFDEGSDTTVTDVSGQGNHGTLTEATWTTQGKFGAALVFNGTTSWVTVPDAPSLDLTTGMTLEAWVYPTVTLTGWRPVIQKEGPEGQDGVAYFLQANSDVNQPAIGMFINSEEILYGHTRLVAGSWTHLAATYDGTWQRLYINGVEVAQRVQTGLIASSSSALRIGGDSVWKQYFQGRIDEVRIYNRALSVSEIQADMDTPINLLHSLPPLSVGDAVQKN
jgi:PKD repeat protein